MRKRVISWLLTVVMVVSMLPTSVLADTLAADQEQQTQQEQTAPADTDSNVPTEDEETQEQQEPAEKVPVSRSARSGGAALALAEGTVSSAKEFAAMVASGSYKLTADITVTEPYAYDFSGTFDGDGHTVTLNIAASTPNVGLFKTLSGGAVVKNVITAGSISSTEKYVGGIAGFANTYSGDVTIENCKNTAAVQGGNGVGGIFGYCSGSAHSVTITGCANTGTISGTRNSGGICGTLENAHFIKNCYNSGAVTGSNIGGILGRGAKGVLIENCYNLENISNGNAILAFAYKQGNPIEVKNCYALKGSASLLVPADNVTVDSASGFKTETEMKSPAFAATLGSAFQYNGGGYPTLKDPEPVVEKNVVSISVKSAKTTCYTGDELELSVTVTYDDNSSEVITKGFTVAGFDNTAPGKQTVTVTYKEKTDSIEIEVIKKPEFDDFFAGIVNSVEVTNDATYPYVVDMTDSDGLCLRSSNPVQGNTSSTSTITLKAKANVTLSFKYWGCNYDSSYAALTIVKNNSYNPEMRSWGSTQWKDFTIDLKKGDTLRLNLIKTYVSGDYYVKLKDFAVSSLYEVKLTAEPEEADAVVALKDSTGAELKGTNGVYIVSAGEYTYTVSAYGYDTVTETINVAADVAKTVPLTKSAAYSVAFDISRPAGITADPTVTVRTNGKAVYTGDGTGCSLSNGSYAYTVACDGCDNAGGLFSVNGDKMNITVTLAKKAIFEDFFANCQGITVSGDKGKFTIEGAGKDFYLKTTETTTLALTATKNVKLSFSYIANAAGYVEGDWDYDEPDEYYYFTIKKNSTQVKRADRETSWKDFSVELTQGDVLTISYDGYTSYYYAALKNFAAVPFYTLTLKTPDGATVVLKDRSGAEITGKNGAYTVAAGTYTYTVSKFGYETKTGTIKVEGGDVSKDVALTALTAYQVKFNVAPEGAAVTLTHPVGGTIAADENGAYIVYAGETYAYTVAKADYITVSGSFTAAKNDTIKVTLTYAGAGWDGTTKTTPTQDENGVYLIDTAAELAWFADAVNKGDTTISGKLTANINLNGKTWTAIGTDSNKFAGTLDGDEAHHYTVSGLKGSKGLFDYVDSTGKVKNLSVDAVLTANGVVGGIVDFNDGTVENCLFSGSVTNSSSYGAAGGIVGKSEGENSVVRNCVNTGSIKNTTVSYGSTLSVGGIVGYTYGKVESCYSTGKVYVDPAKTTNKAIGGIAGAVKGSSYYEKWGALINCYVIGTVTGPESGIGAVVGTVDSGTSITNCVYLDTVAHVPAMGNVTAGMTAHTADYMRSAEFAVDMGMNQDDGTLNGGFPVLPWQGGTVLSADDLRAVSQAQQSLSLRGMTAADAAKKAKADWYAENVLGLYDLTDNNDKADLCEEYGIEEPGEAVTNPHDYFLTALQKHFYKELGLDAENADRLKADATGVYQLRGLTPVSGDPEEEEETAQTYTGFLTLPASVTVPVDEAEMTVAIAWESSNTALVTVKDDGTAAITAPAGGKATVTLKATLTSGSESKVKTFTLCLWSKAAEQQQTLDDIAAVITARNAAVRPLQGVGLYNDTTDANGKGVEKAFRRLLEEMGYEDVADKAVITYTDGSAKASGFDGAAHEYITANGDVKFFDGAVQLKEAYYAGLEFKVAYGGVEKTITTRAIVGRSFDDVQEQLTEASKTLTWEMIRGENTNEAETDTTGAWDRHAVVGGITSNLTLPYSISGRYDMRVQWAVVDVAEDSNCLYISSDKDSASGVGNIVRPVRPAEGELPEDAGKETLIARVTYTDFDDDPYIKEHITGQNGVEVYADVFFDITVAPFDIDATNEMQTALTDKYQSLLVDFVDKTTKPDLSKVDADLQMPRPYLLQQEGIMTDSYNQKVTMVSLTPDVLGFNGYHAMVYRPLPGEEAAEARYVVTITTRSSGQLLARQEFSFTIQPFTQKELDDAAAFMTEALTENAYWNGIKNENTDKTKVTSDLYPFAEICKNKDGTLEYVRGTVNMTFDGIEADDIPGWLDTEKYRCFRSSRPSVIENELLRVHQPEYNTTVTLDSVLTYTKYAQYWEKFGLNGTEETKEKYKLFEQFYKQPVSVDLRVTGLTGIDDPNENAMITVTVQVDSYNENKHSFTGTNYTFTGKASNDWTAWDAVKACLDNAKYEYTGSGAYLKSITDTKGQTLGEKDDGKSSGWMFGVTPAQGKETLPNTTLDATFIHDGDTVRLFFTNKYIPVDPDEPVDPGTEVPNFDKVYADTKKYIQNNVPAPVVASDRGEWAVLGLARAGVALSDEYIQAYYGKVVAYVQKNMGNDGVLVDPESRNPTVTDNERIILALTAIGKDPANVGGKNLLAALQDRNIMQVTNTSDTDINGLVFGLLALNSGNYTQDSYWLVQAILTQQNADGSWSSSADTKPVGDVDMTAMALQALAPYYNEGGDTTVNAAVDKALQWLSAKYKGTGYTSAESCAQVVVALSALQLNANSDSSFVKTVDGAPTSVLGDLLRYYLGEGQGFKHAASGKTADQKATEQALYAMAAYERYCRRTKALYDMTDAVCAHSFGDWQVVSPATCTADGSRQRVCTRCGAVEVQTLPAAGHKFGEWTTTKKPTCTETGTEKRTCSVCFKVETRVIAALGHTPGTEVSVDKNDHWNICEVCHQPVNKTEHTYVNGIQCVCGAVKSEDGTMKRIEVSDTITVPDTLRDNEKLNSEEKIKAELQLQISRKDSKNTAENTAVFDVRLMIITTVDGEQVETPATKADLVNGRITVLLPYPEAIAANYSKYSFTVAHLVTMADCGLDVGTVEFPAVTKTASGLLVTLTGLSPVAISWTKSTNHYYYNPTATPDKTDSANTADDSQMVLWLGSAVLAAAAVVALTRKKRVSK